MAAQLVPSASTLAPDTRLGGLTGHGRLSLLRERVVSTRLVMAWSFFVWVGMGFRLVRWATRKWGN